MRKITGYYTDCPVCEREVQVERLGHRNQVVDHKPKGYPEDSAHKCVGSSMGVPDNNVTVVRLG